MSKDELFMAILRTVQRSDEMRSLDVIDAVLDLATPVLELIDLEFGVTEEDKLKLESVVRCAEVLLNTHLSEAAKRRTRLGQIKESIEQCKVLDR